MTNLSVNNWVYQSNRLIESSYCLTTLEQKLVRLLASLIKKNDIDFKEYTFQAKELSKLFGKNEKNIFRDIEKASTQLMSKIIKIVDPGNKKFIIYHFIDVAKYDNGLLTLKIHPEMKSFYLNLHEYTKYRLNTILRFKYTYSFRLYELLKQYEKIGIREISILDLKTMLNLGEQYPKYSNLKQRVLLPSQKEINTSSDISFEFQEVKKGNRIISLKFFIKSKKESAEPVVNTELQSINDFVLKFNKKYNAKLELQLVKKLVAKKGFSNLEDTFKTFDLVLQLEKIKRPINSVEAFFVYVAYNGYHFGTNISNIPQHNNFEQREYTEKDFEKFYYDVTKN